MGWIWSENEGGENNLRILVHGMPHVEIRQLEETLSGARRSKWSVERSRLMDGSVRKSVYLPHNYKHFKVDQ